MTTPQIANNHSIQKDEWVPHILTFIAVMANADVPITRFTDTLVTLIKVIQRATPQLAATLESHMRFTPPRKNPLGWLVLLETRMQQHSNSLEPLHWGNAVWKIIHNIAQITNSATDFKHFIDALVYTLPCPKCSDHGIAYSNNHPIIKTTDLFEWTHAFHSNVNHLLAKPNLTLQDARIAYGNSVIPTPHTATRLGKKTSTPVVVTKTNDIKMNPSIQGNAKQPLITALVEPVLHTPPAPRALRVCGSCSRRKQI